jgi:hypothetical protein
MLATTLAEMYNDLVAYSKITNDIDTLEWKIWRQLVANVGEGEAFLMLGKVHQETAHV